MRWMILKSVFSLFGTASYLNSTLFSHSSTVLFADLVACPSPHSVHLGAVSTHLRSTVERKTTRTVAKPSLPVGRAFAEGTLAVWNENSQNGTVWPSDTLSLRNAGETTVPVGLCSWAPASTPAPAHSEHGLQLPDCIVLPPSPLYFLLGRFVTASLRVQEKLKVGGVCGLLGRPLGVAYFLSVSRKQQVCSRFLMCSCLDIGCARAWLFWTGRGVFQAPAQVVTPCAGPCSQLVLGVVQHPYQGAGQADSSGFYWSGGFFSFFSLYLRRHFMGN